MTSNIEKKHLYLDYQDPQVVIFRKGEDLPSNDWQRVALFWLKGNIYNLKDTISVDLSDFLSKQIWLPKIWSRDGFSYTISDELKIKININSDHTKEFETACDSKGNNFSYDLSNLGLVRQLTDHQYINVSGLISKSNGANFSVPGAGKTMTTLVTWKYLNLNNDVKKLVVICPKSAFGAWEDEGNEIFSIPPSFMICDGRQIRYSNEIFLLNYEKLENEEIHKKLKILIQKYRVMVVLDEAHRLKAGSKSVRWIACRNLINSAFRVELLTGTPMPQGYDDIRNLFSLSWRGIDTKYLTDQRLGNLKRGSIFVRTTKSELKLPEPTFNEIELEPGLIQWQIYTALRRSYAGSLNLNMNDEELLASRGKAVMTLIAAASNPGLINGIYNHDAYLNLSWPPNEIRSNEGLLNIIQSYASKEIPPKYEWIAKFVNSVSIKQEKVIVWSNFIGNLLSMKRLLKNFNPAIIYGAVTEKNRKKELEKFKYDKNCNVLLTNPQTLGEGISLHKFCSNSVYLDRSYNAGQYLQSLDRIHRLGLEDNAKINFYILRTRKTIDDRIKTRLVKKINRMAQMLDDEGLMIHGSLDDTASFQYEFSNADLNDLLKHLGEND